MRFIGIVHRIKKTQKEEARPTMVAILEGSSTRVYELEEDDAELDFLKCQYPIKWRRPEEDEDISSYNPSHCKWAKATKEEVSTLPAGHIRTVKIGKVEVHQKIVEVPLEFEGLRSGDNVAMIFGGSGDRLASALSRQGEKIGSSVYRIPPNNLKQIRGERDKKEDHILLAKTLQGILSRNSSNIEPFYLFRPRDRQVIRVRESFLQYQDSQRARIGCYQRILQQTIGKVFLSESGFWPDGKIEDLVRQEIANDEIFQQLQRIEDGCRSKMHKAVKLLSIWPLFEDIEGCGPRIVAGIVSAIGDISRFIVSSDPVKMQELYDESRCLEKEGKFSEDLDKVKDRVNPGDTNYRKLQLVASWKRNNDKAEEAELLEQAILCHKERAKLRRKARMQSRAKLKSFCGAYPQVGGKFGDSPKEKQFPRHRAGEVGNWNPMARQSLYQLGDQFNRRPNSVWGQKLLAEKKRLQEKYPEPILVEVKSNGATKNVKRYTKGHIHKMAIWATLSKFVEYLCDEWIRIETQN